MKNINLVNIRLFIIISVTALFASCAIVESRDATLKMEWKAGPPTRHDVSVEVVVARKTQRGEGETELQNTTTRLKASYTQTINEHQEGLLVSFSDLEVPEQDYSQLKNAPSEMQKIIVNVTSLAFGARSDFIMSPGGEFIRLHQVEQFKEDMIARIKEIAGAENTKVLEQLIPSFIDEKKLEEQILRDLQLLKDWEQMTLVLDTPVDKVITPAFTSKDKTDFKVDGRLSYHGETDCNWNAQSACIDLRISNNDEYNYDARLIAERDSLFPHEYRASSRASVESESLGDPMNIELTSEFIHTVNQE